jgi:hypothetical protein
MDFSSFPWYTWLIVGVGLVIGGLVVALMIKQEKDKKLSKELRELKRQAKYRKLAAIYSQFPFTAGLYHKVREQIQNLSVYKPSEVTECACKYIQKILMWQVIIIAVCVFALGDLFSIGFGLIFAQFVGTAFLGRELDKLRFIVYRQTAIALSNVRQGFLATQSVVEAISEAVIPPRLMMAFDKIQNILTSSDGENKLLQFYETCPFRLLQTFATVAYQVENQGDEYDPLTGHSTFLDALTLITQDINDETWRMSLIKIKFGNLVYMPLISLFLIPVAEFFFRSNMPGTTVIYDGVAGLVGKVVVLLFASIAMYVITMMSSQSGLATDDRVYWIEDLIHKDGFIAKIAKDIQPKDPVKGKKAGAKTKLQLKLSAAMSRKSPMSYRLEQVVYGFIGIFIGVFLVAFALWLAQGKMATYYDTYGMSKSLLLDKLEKSNQIQKIERLDALYFSDPEVRALPDTSPNGGLTLADWVQNQISEATTMEAQEQSKRLRSKEKMLNGLKPSPLYLIGVFAVAFGLMWMPFLQLKLRKYQLQSEVEEDFLQIQSLTAVLMGMQMDTLDVLEQLCTNSRIHQIELLSCYHSYPSDPEKELERLRTKLTFQEIKRFVENLKLTNSELSVKEAFSDLLIEREYMTTMRKMAQETAIKKKRNIAGMIAKAPLITAAVFFAVIPILVLGVSELGGALGAVNSM